MTGRVFRATRRVRLSDVNASGHVRLDALARYLQDVGGDDTADAGLPDAQAWVVRRVRLRVHHRARLNDHIELETYCGGTGPRWAERCTAVLGVAGPDREARRLVEAAALWVYVDLDTGTPRPLPAEFAAIYGQEETSRRVSARLRHAAPTGDTESRPWPLRTSDFDMLGHVNNSVYWSPVEDELAARVGARVQGAEMEFRSGIGPSEAVELRVAHGETVLKMWYMVGDEIRASAQVEVAARNPYDPSP